MLVLSRRAEQEIVIDGRIRIKVLTHSRGKVRLGISAPDEVLIQRSEQVVPELAAQSAVVRQASRALRSDASSVAG